MYLLVDVGNSRAKWALSDGATVRDHAVAAHAELPIALRAYLTEHGNQIAHTVVANVAGQALGQAIESAVSEHLRSKPLFLQSTPELCGIRNAYAAPERLGIDRLVAMIGARNMDSAALCVVCVGTAMTIDVLDRAGQHLGGLIVPGPRLMVSSLISNTSEIGPRAAIGERSLDLLATDTRGAIEQGAEQTLAALVDRVKYKIEARSSEPLTVMLTGGAADAIASLLTQEARIVPDLTLQGLAVVARSLFPG